MGGAHLWFPTYQKVQALIARSRIGQCSSHHLPIIPS